MRFARRAAQPEQPSRGRRRQDHALREPFRQRPTPNEQRDADGDADEHLPDEDAQERLGGAAPIGSAEAGKVDEGEGIAPTPGG